MTHTVKQLLAWLDRDTARLKTLGEETEKVLARRDARIVAIRALDHSPEMLATLAEKTGIKEKRIYQVAPSRAAKQAKQATAVAQEEESEPEPEPEHHQEEEQPAAPGRDPLPDDQLPDRFRPGVTGRIGELLSGLATDSWSKQQSERQTIFVDTVTGEWCAPSALSGKIHWPNGSAAELLAQLPQPVERVYLVGPRPTTAGVPGADQVERQKMWFMQTPPEGWIRGRHYFPDEGSPIGKWERLLSDGKTRPVDVTLAAEWFGSGQYTVRQAATAWAMLASRIKVDFDPYAIMMTTPSTTGRDLWRRIIGKDQAGKGKTFPVLSTELRELIRSTSGQGRREVIAEGPQTIDGFAQYDMRFAYAALAWGLPVGAPAMVTGRQWEGLPEGRRELMFKRRGRWLVTAQVPSGWEHVGILPAPSAGAWCWPRRPGQRFTTWITGTEAQIADAHGWKMQVHEGFTFEEGKPLNLWRDKLAAMYKDASSQVSPGDPNETVMRLLKVAIRNIVLMSIGAFHARKHMITRHAPMTPEGEKLLPRTAEVSIVGDQYEWKEEAEQKEWVLRQAHPEWSAEIYGRCRGRLLDCPTGRPGEKVGALHVAPGMVLGMRTDALYLAGDPGWHDDGQLGRLRLESKMDGPLARPQTDADLSLMKAAAAARGAGA